MHATLFTSYINNVELVPLAKYSQCTLYFPGEKDVTKDLKRFQRLNSSRRKDMRILKYVMIFI